MQSEWNGLMLSLVMGVLALALRFRIHPNRSVMAVAIGMCGLASFFTYTRASAAFVPNARFEAFRAAVRSGLFGGPPSPVRDGDRSITIPITDSERS